MNLVIWTLWYAELVLWYMSHCQNSYALETCLHCSEWVFSPSTIEMSHRDMRKAPFFNPGAPENHRRKSSLIKKKVGGAIPPLTAASVKCTLAGTYPTACDNNESRKEGNDSVSDEDLMYEGPVNWCLLWGDAYLAALLQDIWLSSSRLCSHDAFMTHSNFHNEIFMIVTWLPKFMYTGVWAVQIVMFYVTGVRPAWHGSNH